MSVELQFLILALGVWRVSSLLVQEDGPLRILARLRWLLGARLDKQLGTTVAHNPLAELLLCVWCTSLWVAFGFALFANLPTWVDWLLYSLALSAVAIIIQAWVRPHA